MYISCLIGFIIIFLYCIVITVKNREIPNSISQMVYSLDEKHKWTFTAVMFAVAFLIVPQMMTVASTVGYEFLSYLTIVGILGVGADPLVKGEKNIVHYVSAMIMGISSQILVYLVKPYLLMLWIPYILYTLFMDDGRKNMFMGEMVMLSSMAMACLLHV